MNKVKSKGQSEYTKKAMVKCNLDMLPVRDALTVLQGKWKIPLLISISHGNHRFKEIMRSISKLTDKSLSKELKELVEDQLIVREVFDEFPPRVEYRLTEHAYTLTNVIESLKEWGIIHRKKILG